MRVVHGPASAGVLATVEEVLPEHCGVFLLRRLDDDLTAFAFVADAVMGSSLNAMPTALYIQSAKTLSLSGEFDPASKCYERRWRLPGGRHLSLLEEEDAADTHGVGILWPSSVVAAQVVQREGLLPGLLPAAAPPADFTLLELGSGVGLAALAAAAAFPAAHVVATEQRSALPFLERNTRRNSTVAVTVRELDWATLCGGRAAPLWLREQPPDVVLATDVVYSRDSFPLLLGVFGAVFDLNPHCVVLFVADDDNVPSGQTLRTSFLSACRSRGFAVASMPMPDDMDAPATVHSCVVTARVHHP